MNIYLGNLSVKEMEARLGVELKPADRKFLENTREQKADVRDEMKWHCFDMPFAISCGSTEMAGKVRDILSPYASNFKCQIQLFVNKKAGAK